MGISRGTAEVEYESIEAAREAIRQFNGKLVFIRK